MLLVETDDFHTEAEAMILEPGRPMQAPVIDRAGDADLEPIKGLFREAFERNHPGGDWRKVRRAVSVELAKAVAEQKVLGGQVILVARSPEGSFLGYIWWEYQVCPDAVLGAMVQGLGVKKGFRSMGIGKLLVSAMTQWVHRNLSGLAKPARRISCVVSPKNGPVLKVIQSMGGEVKYLVARRDIEPLEVG